MSSIAECVRLATGILPTGAAMMLTSNVRTAVVAVLLFAVSATAAFAAERPSDEWLRGSGEELEICLRGDVFDFDGQATSNLQVTGKINATLAGQSLKAMIDGHKFKIWVPVNKLRWYSLWLHASSSDSDRIAYKQLSAYDLRQAAIDGIKLTLESPTAPGPRESHRRRRGRYPAPP